MMIIEIRTFSLEMFSWLFNFASKKKLLTTIIIALIICIPLRYQILRQFVPHDLEKIAYAFIGHPQGWHEPVLWVPFQISSAQNMGEYTFTNQYRGLKIVCLYFDNYDYSTGYAATLLDIDSAQLELWRQGKLVYSGALIRQEFGDGSSKVPRGRNLLIGWIEGKYIFIDEPVTMKIRVIRGSTDGGKILGRAYLAVVNAASL